MSNSFIYNDEDDLNELYSEEEEEQEEIDDRGVSVIYEDEEVERINEDNFLFSDFPNYYEILNEGNSVDEVPENLDEATHEADVLMYKAKALGKSQTAIQVA